MSMVRWWDEYGKVTDEYGKVTDEYGKVTNEYVKVTNALVVFLFPCFHLCYKYTSRINEKYVNKLPQNATSVLDTIGVCHYFSKSKILGFSEYDKRHPTPKRNWIERGNKKIHWWIN